MKSAVIHLDTNFLVAALKSGSPQQTKVDYWLAANEPVGISAVAWAEFFAGPVQRHDEFLVRLMFDSVESLSGQDAESAAALFNKTGRRSRSLADCMIAAIAIRCGAKLATINTADFQPFTQHGLVLA